MTDPQQGSWDPVPLPRSRSAERRFARALGADPVAAADAWAWLGRPDRPGPSGAAGPLQQLAPLQRALYRREAPTGGPERLARLERRLLADRAAARRALEAAAPPSRRSAIAAGAAAAGAVAIAVVAVVASSSSPPPAGQRRAVSAAARDLPARPLRVTAEERDRILRLLDRATASPEVASRLRNRVQSDIDQTADGPYPADGRRQARVPGIRGGVAVGSSAHAVPLAPGGAVTIAVALSRAAPWRARLTGAGAAAVRVAGSASDGRLQYALLLPGAARFTGLQIDVSGTVAYSWQLLQRT